MHLRRSQVHHKCCDGSEKAGNEQEEKELAEKHVGGLAGIALERRCDCHVQHDACDDPERNGSQYSCGHGFGPLNFIVDTGYQRAGGKPSRNTWPGFSSRVKHRPWCSSSFNSRTTPASPLNVETGEPMRSRSA